MITQLSHYRGCDSELTLSGADLTARLHTSALRPFKFITQIILDPLILNECVCTNTHTDALRGPLTAAPTSQQTSALPEMSLNKTLNPLPDAGLISGPRAWPLMSQRRGRLKQKTSINIKVHRPDRAAKTRQWILFHYSSEPDSHHTHTHACPMALCL